MPKRRAIQLSLALLAAGMFLTLHPLGLRNATLLLTSSWSVMSGPPPNSLEAAILNCTSSFDQLAHLVSDFFQQPGMDPAMRERFSLFLAERAAKSYPRLESTLDWLLAIYKFIFPFLIISLVAKLQGPEVQAQGGSSAPANGAGAANVDRLGTSSSTRAEPAGPLALATAGGGTLLAGSGGSLSHDRRRQMALSSAIVRAARGSALDDCGPAAGRAGSQSPAGPDTPMESARLLPEHPAVRQDAGGGKAARYRPPLSEITATGGY